MSIDRITLTAPAKGEYAKTARMTAATLGSRIGMSYDEVDDVRMAAEEAFVYAVDSAGGVGEVSLTFSVTERAVEMEVALGVPTELADEDADLRTELATFILDAVCDHYEFASDESGARTLRIVKRVEDVDGD